MKIQETVREDGLRVVSCQIPGTKVVSVKFSVGVGSGYDPPDKDGLFHFFEHMAFKGTKRRAASDLEAMRQRHFLSSNAGTSRISTDFYGECIYPKLGNLCDFLHDICFCSVFPEEELRIERGVVGAEIIQGWDNPLWHAWFVLMENLWQHNPLRKYGVGTIEGIARITREDLLRAQEQWYVPSNAVVIAIGHVAHQALVEEMNSRLPLCPARVEKRTWDDEYGDIPSKRIIDLYKEGLRRSVVYWGLKLPTIRRQDEKASLMRRVAGRILDELLHQEVRERRGLVYSVSTQRRAELFLASSFAVQTETLPENAETVRSLVFDILTRPLSDGQLFARVAEKAWDNLFIEHDYYGLAEMQDLIADQIACGLPAKSLEGFFRRQRKDLASLRIEDIEEWRRDNIVPEKLVSVMMSPA